jgi:hypothetical protein
MYGARDHDPAQAGHDVINALHVIGVTCDAEATDPNRR